jgi:hypothetical protein
MAREAVMSRFWEVMKHEFHEVLPPTIFFLVAFHIVVLDRILLLRQYGLSLSSVAGATVAALLVAKIVLITDKFPFVNRFPIFIYCASRELVRAIGRKQVQVMFFGASRASRP